MNPTDRCTCGHTAGAHMWHTTTCYGTNPDGTHCTCTHMR